MKNIPVLFVIVVILLSACAPAAPANRNLILATTTSTQDSGLLDVLVPLFEAKTGYTVQTIAVGTGQALKQGEEGNADVLLVHAPSSVKTFMDGGFGREKALVMHNDFVIVGPAQDPAGIAGMGLRDAFSAIAASGATFISRGDDSGTHKMELTIWENAGQAPAGQAWYLETGQGMGATLTIASEKSGYTLTDRATYLANRENLNLAILLEGDPSLLNFYHVITVNPDLHPNINYSGALAFLEFLQSDEAQQAIGQFGVEQFGQPLFFPDGGKTDADYNLP